MPTDLDTIEGRLRETLAAAAEQTVIDHDAVLATVSPLAVAGPRRRSPRRAWIAVAVAAAAVLLVGFVVVARTDDASVTTATTPPGPSPAAAPGAILGLGYLPDGSRPPVTQSVTLQPGETAHWDTPIGTIDVRYDAQQFRPSAPGTTFAGRDGLTFQSTTDARIQLLQQQMDDIKERYSEVFEEAKTAPPEEQEILKQQKDALVKQSADLDAQLAALRRSPTSFQGGRADATLTLSGTVGQQELKRVAMGLLLFTPLVVPMPGNVGPTLPLPPTGTPVPPSR